MNFVTVGRDLICKEKVAAIKCSNDKEKSDDPRAEIILDGGTTITPHRKDEKGHNIQLTRNEISEKLNIQA